MATNDHEAPALAGDESIEPDMSNAELLDWVKMRFACKSDYALAARLNVSRQALSKFRKGEGRSVAGVILAQLIKELEGQQ